MRISSVLDAGEKRGFMPVVKVIGVGGAGNNAVANMIRHGLSDVEFIVANTDLQTLLLSPCENRIQLGSIITSGLGAGAVPTVGRDAAEESREAITDAVRGAHVIFVAAGMGGGTGTGAAPVIAGIAKDLGIMTIGVVTKPFMFEGADRMKIAEIGLAEMDSATNTMVVISNQSLFRLANATTSFSDAFIEADNVLYECVRAVVDLFWKPGLINLDLADVRSVLSDNGLAMIGSGEAYGEGRAMKALEFAIVNPLLEDIVLSRAQGILLNITGGCDMTLFEVEEIASSVSGRIKNSPAKFIFGATIDESLEGSMRVSIIATGVQGNNPVDSSSKMSSASFDDSLSSECDTPSSESSREDSEAANNLSFIEDFSDDGTFLESDGSEAAVDLNNLSPSPPSFAKQSTFSTIVSDNDSSFSDDFFGELPPVVIDSSLMEVIVTDSAKKIESTFVSTRSSLSNSSSSRFHTTLKNVPVRSSESEVSAPDSVTISVPSKKLLTNELDNDSFPVTSPIPSPENEIQEGGFWGRLKRSLHNQKKVYDAKIAMDIKKKLTEDDADFLKGASDIADSESEFAGNASYDSVSSSSYTNSDFANSSIPHPVVAPVSIDSISCDDRLVDIKKDNSDASGIVMSFNSVYRCNQDVLFGSSSSPSSSGINGGSRLRNLSNGVLPLDS